MSEIVYDEKFTTMTEGEFRRSAAPLVEAYRATFGKNRDTVRDARNALEAHCKAWAGRSKARKKIVEALLLEAIDV
jgi:hypothetical protein